MLFIVFALVLLIFYLSLILISLITVFLCAPSWIYPLWDFLCFQDWLIISIPLFRNFSAITSANIYLGPNSLFSFWGPYNANVGAFNVVPEVFQDVSIFFHSFIYILFCGSDFYHSVLQVIYPCFCLSYSAIDSFQCYLSLFCCCCCCCSLVLLGLW